MLQIGMTFNDIQDRRDVESGRVSHMEFSSVIIEIEGFCFQLAIDNSNSPWHRKAAIIKALQLMAGKCFLLFFKTGRYRDFRSHTNQTPFYLNFSQILLNLMWCMKWGV